MAADLDRGRQLLVLDGERLVGDDEAADLLDHAEVGIDPVDRGRQRLDVIGIVGELVELAFAVVRRAPFGGPFGVGERV